MVFGFLTPAQNSVSAATTLTIEPITWNVIGLDSNNVYVGPNTFPIGARVCNYGIQDSGVITANFVWDSANQFVNISGGTSASLDYPGLTVGECTDFYYEVEVTRNSSAYDTTRRYHIAVTESGNPTTYSTPIPRELYVEHLISQSRNGQLDLELSTDGVDFESFAAGETLTLLKGQSYFLRLTAKTATNGYEQIESYLNLPNIYFRVLSVTTDYSVGADSDRLYGDGCTWENDPNSPNYRSCLGTGKNGGDVITTYEVYIIDYRSGDPTPVNGMIYDFSGSSYHYNADYVGDARDLYNLDPAQIPFTKTFVPNQMMPGEVSQANFQITNPSSMLIEDVAFTDVFPTGMSIAADPGLSYTGCGTSANPDTVSPGAISIDFTGITLAPYGTCTIKLNVTAPTTGDYPNETGELTFTIDDVPYTGSTAADNLSVAENVVSCNTGAEIAYMDVVDLTYPYIPTFTRWAPNVAVATASMSTAGSSSTPLMAGNYVWEITGKMQSINPGAPVYYEFTVDTTYYKNILLTLSLARNSKGPRSFDITYTPNGGIEAPLTTITDVSETLTQYGGFSFGNEYLPAGNTVIRLYPYDASNPGNDASANLDYFTLTGDYCEPPPPSITKEFVPDPILVNGTSQLTFNVTNTSINPPSGPLTGIVFSDTLPTGLNIAAGAQTNDCGGILTATETTSSISMSGVSLAAGAFCSITIPVVGLSAGVFTNVSERISTTESGENNTSSGFAMDDITVIGPPSIIKTFADETILTGDTTSLTEFKPRRKSPPFRGSEKAGLSFWL